MKKTLKLKPKFCEQGYTTTSNINPDYIAVLKKDKKRFGNLINAAIKSGEAKKAVKLMQKASGYNRYIREAATKHNNLVYDSTGQCVAVWDYKARKAFAFEA